LTKLNRLGVVVVKQNFQRTTTTEVTDKDLMTHEQALKVLAGLSVVSFLKQGFLGVSLIGLRAHMGIYRVFSGLVRAQEAHALHEVVGVFNFGVVCFQGRCKLSFSRTCLLLFVAFRLLLLGWTLCSRRLRCMKRHKMSAVLCGLS